MCIRYPRGVILPNTNKHEDKFMIDCYFHFDVDDFDWIYAKLHTHQHDFFGTLSSTTCNLHNQQQIITTNFKHTPTLYVTQEMTNVKNFFGWFQILFAFRVSATIVNIVNCLLLMQNVSTKYGVVKYNNWIAFKDPFAGTRIKCFGFWKLSLT